MTASAVTAWVIFLEVLGLPLLPGLAVAGAARPARTRAVAAPAANVRAFFTKTSPLTGGGTNVGDSAHTGAVKERDTEVSLPSLDHPPRKCPGSVQGPRTCSR